MSVETGVPGEKPIGVVMYLTPAERAGILRQLRSRDADDYEVVESAEWSSDALMLNLCHGLSYWEEEFHYYFWGFNELQRANISHIMIACSPTGTLNYEAVIPPKGPTGFFAKKADGTSALVSADICWFTPGDMRAYDWVAVVPKGFDLDAADPTDGVRYFVSSSDAQVLFLGLFALIVDDSCPEVFQWKFPGWTKSDWSVDELADRRDAVISEHTYQEIDEYYPGATRVRPGGDTHR
ncbi:hypothetical protein [Cryobacterium sp. TMT2-42-4]|uniref:hypothetical protein n=1 Tax=Cryobacterium sp. TMT2-42-4 TaxID=1259255 RepID=UPI00106B9884|nr:hypothetical protein [Cryobacterium sp. TMT2-42-4]TFC34127.1 hypothetical protein E3O18_12615 [Cryobacterium sp. TMT2-42-4]